MFEVIRGEDLPKLKVVPRLADIGVSAFSLACVAAQLATSCLACGGIVRYDRTPDKIAHTLNA